MTFKEFMATTADHVQPKEAEVMYKEYMINELGDAKKVWFTEHHDSEELRSKYDPVRLEEALKRREGEAKASVSEFLEGRTRTNSTIIAKSVDQRSVSAPFIPNRSFMIEKTPILILNHFSQAFNATSLLSIKSK